MRRYLVALLFLIITACGGNADESATINEAVSATLTALVNTPTPELAPIPTATADPTPTAAPTHEPTPTSEPAPKPTATAEEAAIAPSRLAYAPQDISDMLPELGDLEGAYTRQSSSLTSHPEIDNIPGRGKMVVVGYLFDTRSVSNPEDHTLLLTANCVEFQDQAGAVLALKTQIEITQKTPRMKLGPLMEQPFGDESYAAEGTFPLTGTEENIAHVWVRAGNFACQYMASALKGYHQPLADVQHVVEKIIRR